MSRAGGAVWAVLGLGFGDEGKGLATDYLCRQHPGALVVRFNGGPQAGHTVVADDGRRHVFSSFGAGTLRGSPTFWSKYCPFSPAGALPEYAALVGLGARPRLLVDGRCPVTTHYDVLYNRAAEARRAGGTGGPHGSCGLGVGATVERHATTPLRFCAHDLLTPGVLRHRLGALRAHYRARLAAEGLLPAAAFDGYDHDGADARFAAQGQELGALHAAGHVRFTSAAEVFGGGPNPWPAVVFEGAQGLLLDQQAGFFPHVTRSATTARNALKICRRHLAAGFAPPQVLYVSRAYATRHGAGPLPHEQPLPLRGTAPETNQPNPHQGALRYAPLSRPLLRHALRADAPHTHGLARHLLLTCLDQTPGGQVLYADDEPAPPRTAAPADFAAGLGAPFASLLTSHGPAAANISGGPLL